MPGIHSVYTLPAFRYYGTSQPVKGGTPFSSTCCRGENGQHTESMSADMDSTAKVTLGTSLCRFLTVATCHLCTMEGVGWGEVVGQE